MALILGVRLGPYEIVAPLGAGGMGLVYKARDTRLDRIVAVKVLPDDLAADPRFRERFDREARSISQLTHAHICTLYDVGEHNGTAFLVMELLDGETLGDRLARGALPLDEALKTAIQIADALNAAHSHGIVHRDLKPGNVMITKAGAKLLDFGLAKTGATIAGRGLSMLSTTPPNLTAQGTILGTFQYMAPEQLEGLEADTRTDVFAFGVLVYEMATGKNAFEGRSRASLIGAILKDQPPPIAAVQPLAPAALDRLVRTCLAKDPDERWQSISDLKRELQWIAAGGAQNVGALPMAGPRHAREVLAWGAATLATLLAMFVSVQYFRAPTQRDAIVRFTVPPPLGTVRPAAGRFAVSPDGKTLAFITNGADGVRRLSVRRLNATQARLVADTDGARGPFWSPDSRSLGFAKNNGLYRVDLDKSPPRRLCDLPERGLFLGGTWSAKGVIVLASEDRGLFRVPDIGGTPSPLTTLDSGAKELVHTGPWFLPDDRQVLFLAFAEGQTQGVVWATAIDDPARTRVIESVGAAAYADGLLLSTAGSPRSVVAQPFDPKRLALSGTPQLVRDQVIDASGVGEPGFSISSNGVLVAAPLPTTVHQFEWVDRSGRTVGTVGPSAAIDAFALAPDERRVVAQLSETDRRKGDLWLFEAGREAGTRLTYERGASSPVWALDGRDIYFTQSDLGLRTLAIGQRAQTAFENPGAFRSIEDVTRDGRYAVFRSTTAPSAIWIQRVGNSGERRALVQGGPFAAVQARVSPDSRWLAYTLDLPSGPEVFLQPFDRPGDRIQLSSRGGSGPVWRDDSRELYYEGSEGVMAVPLSERSGTLDAGTPQKLFARRTVASLGEPRHNVEVAAHGQRFLVNTVVGNSDDVPLEVTLNWMTELKK